MNFINRLVKPFVISVVVTISIGLSSMNTIGNIQNNDPNELREQRRKIYLLYLRGRDSIIQNDLPNAVNIYKEIIQLNSKIAAPHVAIGEINFYNRNLKDAEAEAKIAIELEKDNASAHRLLGMIYENQAISGVIDKSKAQEAIVHLLEVLRIDGYDPDIYSMLAKLYLANEDTKNALDAYQKLLGSGLARGQDYDIVSRIYFEKGIFRDAALAARQSYLMSSKSPQLAARLAQALLRSGQTTEALEVYEEVLPGNENNVGLLLGYADILMRTGKYTEASREAQKVIGIEPGNLDAFSTLAQSERRSGKREEAVKILQQALKGQDVTDSLQLQFELAETLVEMGKTNEAVQAYETALKALINPDETVSEKNLRNAGIILRRIVGVYRIEKNRNKIFSTYAYMKKLLGDKDTLANILEIDTLREENKYAEALKATQDAQKRFPEERQFQYFEAQFLAKLGKVDQAISQLQKLISNTSEESEIYWMIGLILMESNRLDESEKMIRRALQYDEKNVDYLVALSSVQDRRKLYKESEETLRLILSLDPDNPTALNNLGYFLVDRNEKLDEAIDLIHRAVNIDPINSSFLDSLGWAYYKQNKFELAVQYIEQAAGFDNSNPTMHDHLGDSYQKLSKMDLARKHWKLAIELSINPEDIKRIQNKMK